MPRITAIWLISILMPLTACAPSSAKLEAFARRGEIQDDAPIKADAAIRISAPIQRVWGVLTDIDHWPTWQADISTATLNGRLAPGSTFKWKSGGLTVRSRLSVVRPRSMIAWRGRALGLNAVHIWILTPQPDGAVLVRTRESMDGFPISLLYPSAKLQASDVAWLASLKRAAEAAPGS